MHAPTLNGKQATEQCRWSFNKEPCENSGSMSTDEKVYHSRSNLLFMGRTAYQANMFYRPMQLCSIDYTQSIA